MAGNHVWKERSEIWAHNLFELFKLKAGATSMETDQQKLVISDETTNCVIKKGGEVVVDYISGDNWSGRRPTLAVSTSTVRRNLDAYQKIELNSEVCVYVGLPVVQLGGKLAISLKGKRKLQAHIEGTSCDW